MCLYDHSKAWLHVFCSNYWKRFMKQIQYDWIGGLLSLNWPIVLTVHWLGWSTIHPSTHQLHDDFRYVYASQVSRSMSPKNMRSFYTVHILVFELNRIKQPRFSELQISFDINVSAFVQIPRRTLEQLIS